MKELLYAGRDGEKVYCPIKVLDNGIRIGLRPLLHKVVMAKKGNKNPPLAHVGITYRLRIDSTKGGSKEFLAGIAETFLSTPARLKGKGTYASYVGAISGVIAKEPTHLDAMDEYMTVERLTAILMGDLSKMLPFSAKTLFEPEDLKAACKHLKKEIHKLCSETSYELSMALEDFNDPKVNALPDPSKVNPDTVGFGDMMKNVFGTGGAPHQD
ncbi:hypothetical protein [Vibrio phage V-YDF132]|nr:hypothetical protein [Vibrio phage V-YDF132]